MLVYNLFVKRLSWYFLPAIFLLAFLLRLTLTTLAHHGDLNNNISWGKVAIENGLNGFYGSSDSDDWEYSAPNQPPLTILMFAGTQIIFQAVRDAIWYLNWELQVFPSQIVWFWDEKGMDILVKLPSILADLGIGFLIYGYFKDLNKQKLGLKLSALWLFNPVIWYNSAIWGQTDSIVNLLGLMAVLALLEKKLLRFSLFFILSILFKGSLSIFIPVLILVALKQKHSIKDWFLSVIYSLLTAISISIWFHPKFDFFTWFINLYKVRILPGEIGYLTANAFNFWWLVDPGKTYDNILYFGLSARIWGIVITLMFFVVTLIWLSKKLSYPKIIFSLTISALVSFLFMTRIHERYLYPFFPYATIFLGMIPSFWPIYTLISLTHLLNLYHLFWSPSLPFLESLYQNSNFANLLAIINLLLFILIFRHLRSAKL